MEYFTDTDFKYEKRVWEDFEIKYLVEYQVLYIHADTLLLADIFKDYELKPACFFSLPEIAW